MLPKFDFGDEVRLIRNVRNDGTYPGLDTGTLLVRRGSIGNVVNVGTFLQDQLIYTVHFIDIGKMIGCREEELQAAGDPWIPNRFEFREKVTPTITLAVDGEVIAAPGDEGEIEKLLRDADTIEQLGGIHYHVRFAERTLLIPERILAPFGGEPEENDERREAHG